MRKVSKPRSKIPPAWVLDAQAETIAAIAHFRAMRAKKKPAPKGTEFKFSAYRDSALRDALNVVYGNKCAYCEVDYGATQPVAVEHYRPKGAVVENGKTTTPGYFWLAANWENLFPSCTDCNSPRKHPMPGGGKELLGKGNQFPLAPGSTRATRPGRERLEVPLLLNPSRNDPDCYLLFVRDQNGDVTVEPAKATGVRVLRAKESIRVYALNRVGLVKRRRDHALRLRLQLNKLARAFDDHRRFPANLKRLQAFDEELRQLKSAYLEPEHEFLGMTRQLVLDTLPSLRGKL